MKRDLCRLSDLVFDVVVVGGGIYGLFTAWDATLRGLSVALVEKGDFGHATSGNTFRVIHGGLRYLQNGDLRRMRRSIIERTNLMRIAPHLVHPLPFLLPTYGHGLRGKQALWLALKAHDMVGFDRNRLNDPDRRLPSSRVISREQAMGLFRGFQSDGLTGAAIYYDCQMHSPDRLMLSVGRSAANAGATLANYVEAARLMPAGPGMWAVGAKDVLSGDELEIRARFVVNATGPWADRWLTRTTGRPPRRRLLLSKAFNLLVRKRLVTDSAVGLYTKSRLGGKDPNGSERSRMFFIAPHADGSLIGTAHLPYQGDPDAFEVTESEVGAFIEEINAACPDARLESRDVLLTYSGLLPADHFQGCDVQLAKHYRIWDHAEEGLECLVSLVGVKFTESRLVAEKAVDMVFRKLGKSPPRCRTAITAVHGGQIDRLDDYLQQEMRRRPTGLSPSILRDLVGRYGSAYSEVLECMDAKSQTDDESSKASRLFSAEVRHAVRAEMAMKPADALRGRTWAKPADGEERERLETCASIMAEELGWDRARTQRELDEARDALPLGVLTS